jgi:hypothetical protein
MHIQEREERLEGSVGDHLLLGIFPAEHHVPQLCCHHQLENEALLLLVFILRRLTRYGMFFI